jgi:hypothetical protein
MMRTSHIFHISNILRLDQAQDFWKDKQTRPRLINNETRT